MQKWDTVDPLEPLDIAVLSEPEKHILAAGGSILVVVGVVAIAIRLRILSAFLKSKCKI